MISRQSTLNRRRWIDVRLYYHFTLLILFCTIQNIPTRPLNTDESIIINFLSLPSPVENLNYHRKFYCRALMRLAFLSIHFHTISTHTIIGGFNTIVKYLKFTSSNVLHVRARLLHLRC